jgi:hypothetical protein
MIRLRLDKLVKRKLSYSSKVLSLAIIPFFSIFNASIFNRLNQFFSKSLHISSLYNFFAVTGLSVFKTGFHVLIHNTAHPELRCYFVLRR